MNFFKRSFYKQRQEKLNKTNTEDRQTERQIRSHKDNQEGKRRTNKNSLNKILKIASKNK